VIRYFAAAILAATFNVVVIVTPVQAAPARAQAQHFQIPPGGLGQALDAYIRQSGRQLIYRVDEVRGAHSPGVQGEMSADDALSALLSGTGFSSRSDTSGAIAIVRDDAVLSEIVVTATAGGQGIERQKASFSTTTLNSEDIHKIAPLNTAALLQGIPGVTVHSTGGEQGNNIFVRGFPSSGDAPYVTFQLAGSAVFDPPTVAWFGNADVIRIDEMVEHVEAVRGGPAQVLSNGQVGLTVNILPKTGTDDFHGVGEFSSTDYGKKRFDAQVSGPINENTFFSVGGFYQNGDNVRRLHFDSEVGGQLSANILHKFERGSVLIWGRILQENNTWNLPIPIIVDNGDVKQFPGFDIHTGAIGSPQERELTLRNGDDFRFDRGRGSNISNGGFNFNYDLTDALSVQEKASYLGGSVDTNALFPSSPVSAANEAIALGGTFGSLTNVTTGAALPATTQVMQVGAWIADKSVKNINNDLSFTWRSGSHKLTAGYYFAAFSSRDHWNLGNNLLLQATNNGPILDLTLADGTRVTGPDHFLTGSTTLRSEDYQGTDNAVFVADEWQVTSKLRVDAGVREQYHHIEGSYRNTASEPDGTAIFLNTYTDQTADTHKLAATAGAGYELTSQLGLWTRYSRGNIFPQFDTVQSGLVGTQTVDAFEGGVNYTTSMLRAYGNVFYNKFRGIESFDLAANGATFIRHGGANTYGTEIYGTVGPFYGLSISGSGTYLHARFTDFVDNGIDSSGNQVQAQPQWQGRLNVSYKRDVGFGEFTAYGAATFVGKRFGNETNTQILPSYTKVDAGLLLEIRGGEFIRVSADNLNNSAGLTEGDVRANLTQTNAGVSLGRPLQGRSFVFSAGYRF
jgi:outer membrane receptor protein involved in Fe transport